VVHLAEDLQQATQLALGESRPCSRTADRTLRTDANTVLTLEFLIGGRADVNRDTEVEIVNDRSVAQNGVGLIRMILNTGKLVMDLVTPDRHNNYIWDLEIQTNGGTTGIKG